MALSILRAGGGGTYHSLESRGENCPYVTDGEKQQHVTILKGKKQLVHTLLI